MTEYLVLPEQSIRQCMDCINRNRCGIVLIVNVARQLVGTVTDGDIRRAILAGFSLEDPINKILAHTTELSRNPKAITAVMGTSRAELLHLMQKFSVNQIPLLDSDQAVVDLVTMNQLIPEPSDELQAVVMAGGFGTRLKPFTDNIPKPMLPIGDQPLLEHIIKQFKGAGISRVCVSTHYLSDKIVDYFGNGDQLAVELSYIKESEPLGTAGALGLMARPNNPFIVMNGDILTKLNFRALLNYHREHQAVATLSVRKYELKVPYGVVDSDGINVRGLVEKPAISLFVNAGVYLLEPEVYDYINVGEHLDMTVLADRLIQANKTVVAFPIWEQWLDIGQPIDYELAQTEVYAQ